MTACKLDIIGTRGHADVILKVQYHLEKSTPVPIDHFLRCLDQLSHHVVIKYKTHFACNLAGLLLSHEMLDKESFIHELQRNTQIEVGEGFVTALMTHPQGSG